MLPRAFVERQRGGGAEPRDARDGAADRRVHHRGRHGRLPVDREARGAGGLAGAHRELPQGAAARAGDQHPGGGGARAAGGADHAAAVRARSVPLG